MKADSDGQAFGSYKATATQYDCQLNASFRWQDDHDPVNVESKFRVVDEHTVEVPLCYRTFACRW